MTAGPFTPTTPAVRFTEPAHRIAVDDAVHVVECGEHFHVRVYHPAGGFVAVATFRTRLVADYTAGDLTRVLRAWVDAEVAP